jgi:hypothetical protein
MRVKCTNRLTDFRSEREMAGWVANDWYRGTSLISNADPPRTIIGPYA